MSLFLDSIKNWLNWLKNKLSRKGHSPRGPNGNGTKTSNDNGEGTETTTIEPPPPPPRTVDEIIAQHEARLEKEGARDGKEGIPSSDSQQRSYSEEGAIQAIQNEISQQERAKIQGWNAILDNIQNELDNCGQNVQTTTNKAVGDFRHIGGEFDHGNAALIRKARASSENLQKFMAANKLERPAETINIFFKVVMAMFLIALEMIINDVFLAQEHFSFLEALGPAFFFSAANIIVSMFLGYQSQQIHHVDKWRKFLGGVNIVFWLVLVILFNLFISHFRETVNIEDIDLGKAGVQALENVKSSSLIGLKDIMSWFLCLMGVIFASWAFIEGKSWDDPYPGYGKLQRRHDKYSRRVGEAADLYTGKITRLRERYSNGIALDEFGLNEHQRRLNEIAADINGSEADFRNTCQTLEQGINHTLLPCYRRANRNARGSNPPPAYFAAGEAGQWRSGTLDANIRARYDKVRGRVTEYQQKLANTRGAFRTSLNNLSTEHDKIIKQIQNQIQNI